MKKLISTLDPRNLWTSQQVKPSVILILSALLPALHRYFGSMEFARRLFPPTTDFEASLYMFAAAFLVMGILPVLLVRFGFRESLKGYGLSLGDWRRGLSATLFLFVLIAILLIYPASQTEEIRAVFPFDKAAGDSVFAFLRFQLFRGLFFYSAWEFFFRGFVLFGLRKQLGDGIAICVQAIPSCLWHIGMPAQEIFSSLVAGILFGILVLRTRSILWVFLLHYLIGVILDLFIVITL
jgi:membrane protease YdiL (CAAX protease family)